MPVCLPTSGFLTFWTFPARENICVDTSTSNTLKGSPEITHTGQRKVCTLGPDSNRRPWESRSRTQNPKLNLVLPADRKPNILQRDIHTRDRALRIFIPDSNSMSRSNWRPTVTYAPRYRIKWHKVHSNGRL